MKNIEQTVKELVSQNTYPVISADDLNDETRFKNINIDSLDIIQIAMECEEEFDVTLPDRFVDDVRTIGDLVKLIQYYRK